MSRYLSALLILALSVFAAGCGGDAESGPDAGKVQAIQEYLTAYEDALKAVQGARDAASAERAAESVRRAGGRMRRAMEGASDTRLTLIGVGAAYRARLTELDRQKRSLESLVAANPEVQPVLAPALRQLPQLR
jgi:hypothetical protein